MQVGGVTVPPSAQIYQTTPQPQKKIRLLFSSWLQASKKRRPCKTVQNQALFFHPASSPFIIRIIIVITIIVVNILFEHTTQTDGRRTDFQRHSQLRSQKTDISYYSSAAQKCISGVCLQNFSTRSPTSLFTFPSFKGLESIQ